MSVQILNEIRNCLDHLARADTGKNAEKNIEKAKNHIDRACLDCVKVAWIAFSRDVYKTYDSFTPKQYMMLEEGAYWKKVGLLYEAFQEKSFQARKSEPINLDTDIDTAISDYFDAIAAGKELMETVKAKEKELMHIAALTEKGSFVHNFKWMIIGSVVSAILGVVLGAYLSPYLPFGSHPNQNQAIHAAAKVNSASKASLKK